MEWCTRWCGGWCRPTLKVAATPCRRASTTIRLCESATVSRFVRDWKNMGLATVRADPAEPFTVTHSAHTARSRRGCRLMRARCALVARPASVHACARWSLALKIEGEMAPPKGL